MSMDNEALFISAVKAIGDIGELIQKRKTNSEEYKLAIHLLEEALKHFKFLLEDAQRHSPR